MLRSPHCLLHDCCMSRACLLHDVCCVHACCMLLAACFTLLAAGCSCTPPASHLLYVACIFATRCMLCLFYFQALQSWTKSYICSMFSVFYFCCLPHAANCMLCASGSLHCGCMLLIASPCAASSLSSAARCSLLARFCRTVGRSPPVGSGVTRW